MSKKHYSPLRYPGGKGKLASFMKGVFHSNGLSDGIYIEPYAGGAAVALELLLEEYAWEIVINDIDYSIYCFWHSVLNETEELCAKIQNTVLTVEEWRKQKQIYKTSKEHSKLEVGFSTFYLNRTCRSGILAAGVIGGNNQDGNYKIDARYNKKDLIKRISLIAQYKDRVHLYNLDALELLGAISNKYITPKSLIYFDPPYYVKGSQLYRNFYNHEDHAEISKKVRELSTPWIVTYDNADPIKELYNGCKTIEFSLQYSINNDRKRKATELMFYNAIEVLRHPNESKAA